MKRRYRSSGRLPLPFFDLPQGSQGFRGATPLRPMIRTPAERRSAVEALAYLERQREADLSSLRSLGVPLPVIERLQRTLDSLVSVVRQQLVEHDALCVGDVAGAFPLAELPEALVKLRIARGVSQRALAEGVGVHESAISRGERSLHANLSIQRAVAILRALGLEVEVTVTGLV